MPLQYFTRRIRISWSSWGAVRLTRNFTRLSVANARALMILADGIGADCAMSFIGKAPSYCHREVLVAPRANGRRGEDARLDFLSHLGDLGEV